jgi:predicted RNA-binding Zn-ribbon protein involved in translation (DUF1610 family)
MAEKEFMPGTKKASEEGSVRFMCPACGKAEIVRTPHERKIAAKYKCPECGFEGPN